MIGGAGAPGAVGSPAGTQAAHALTYRLVEPDGARRGALLAETGHAYLSYLPLVLALGTVVVLLAFGADLRTRLGGGRGTVVRPALFASLAPLLFTVQELFERLLHDGGLTAGTLVEPTLLVGLAMQLPFALAAYGLARLLLRASASLARRVAAPRTFVLLPTHRPWAVDAISRPRPRPASHGAGTRGPPDIFAS